MTIQYNLGVPLNILIKKKKANMSCESEKNPRIPPKKCSITLYFLVFLGPLLHMGNIHYLADSAACASGVGQFGAVPKAHGIWRNGSGL